MAALAIKEDLMNHCNQCGTKVSQDAKFCHNCGSQLKVDSAKKAIDANLKVALTNETTEKVLKSVGSSVSSVISRITNIIKKLLKPVIIICISVAIAIGAFELIREAQYEAKREQEEAQRRNAMTFEKEKAIGTFRIEGLSLNGRFLSYSDSSGGYSFSHFSDSWPYDEYGAYNQRPTGKVTISDRKIIIYLDSNRNNTFSPEESTTFAVKGISKSNNPEYYNYGIIETDLDENVIFEIISTSSWGSDISYRLHYKIGEDSYELWLQ